LPGGALVDWVTAKRLLIAAALVAIATGALIFGFTSAPLLIFVAETLHGATAGVLKPAIAAIGLGVVGHRAPAGRLGHALGNAATAAVMGALGHVVSKQATFLAPAALCIPAGWALTRSAAMKSITPVPAPPAAATSRGNRRGCARSPRTIISWCSSPA
jgi:hypothetical protein